MNLAIIIIIISSIYSLLWIRLYNRDIETNRQIDILIYYVHIDRFNVGELKERYRTNTDAYLKDI